MTNAIEYYLPGSRDRDLTLDFRGTTYKLPGLNTLSWDDLFRWYEVDQAGGVSYLAEGFFRDGYGMPEIEVIELSSAQIEAIVERWFKMAAVKPDKIGLVVYVVEKLSQELNYDLRHLLGMDGLTDFLKLPLVDAVDVLQMLMYKETESWTWAYFAKYKFPLSRDAITGVDVVFAAGYKVPQNYSRLVASSDILDIDALEAAQKADTEKERKAKIRAAKSRSKTNATKEQ